MQLIGIFFGHVHALDLLTFLQVYPTCYFDPLAPPIVTAAIFVLPL
jgi:hypothetical protein